ncbi:MAG: bifunctional aspartate kinase/diaminopimelate decarboxylase [Polyangiaceae bacterium]
MQPWVVIKFGGTSVVDRARWTTIANVAEAHRKQGFRVLVVVSALSGMTDTLKRLIESPRGSETHDALVGAFLERHRTLAADLRIDAEADATCKAAVARFVELAASKPEDSSSAFAWQAEVYACGELCSSAFGAAFLRANGADASWLDVRSVLRTSEQDAHASAWAKYLSATCDIVVSADAEARVLDSGSPIRITQGFIAKRPNGETALLGRGGSDTSAAYLGARLGAAFVEIWTDVPGMFSANPKLVPAARLLASLDYAEAQEIAATGAKVLHPRAIAPLAAVRIPLCVRDTTRPTLAGTEIRAEAGERGASQASIKALSSRKGIVLVSMESAGMYQEVGFLADVFAAFKKHGLSIDLVSTAETNVTVSLDPSENLLTDETLSALSNDLAPHCRVKLLRPCAAVTLVGRGIHRLLGKLRDLLAEIGEEDVHLITQSSNDLNFSVVVDEEVAEPLLVRLHELLVHSGAMSTHDKRVFGPTWNDITSEPRLRETPFWRGREKEIVELGDGTSAKYVYDLGTVRARARQVLDQGVFDRVCYAMKANANGAILEALADEGLTIECVSIDELEHVRRSVPSLPGNRILFTPNFAPLREYEAAFAAGAQVTIDNLELLSTAPQLFSGKALFLRVDLGHGHGHHAKVRTGGVRSKFGVSIAELEACGAAARRVSARIIGLHAHLGSGIFDPPHWASVFTALASAGRVLPDVKVLDVGGGFGVPYRSSERPIDWSAVARFLREAKTSAPGIEVWCEPGRYLVAEAGVLVARVTQRKRKDGVAFVGVDTGMNSLLRPALYDAYHPIWNLSRPDDDDCEPMTVVGPICESGDVLGEDRQLPKATAVGDWLVFGVAGAYGAVMGSHYNLRAPAKEHVLRR